MNSSFEHFTWSSCSAFISLQKYFDCSNLSSINRLNDVFLSFRNNPVLARFWMFHEIDLLSTFWLFHDSLHSLCFLDGFWNMTPDVVRGRKGDGLLLVNPSDFRHVFVTVHQCFFIMGSGFLAWDSLRGELMIRVKRIQSQDYERHLLSKFEYYNHHCHKIHSLRLHCIGL